eukprot:4835467-Ditylum_brightwellii.AAC.1
MDDNKECEETHDRQEPQLDGYGLPKGWEQATDVEIVDDRYAVTDHINWFQSAGFGKFSLSEAQHIPHKLQPAWAEAIGH